MFSGNLDLIDMSEGGGGGVPCGPYTVSNKRIAWYKTEVKYDNTT